jgi:hypothetical protein
MVGDIDGKNCGGGVESAVLQVQAHPMKMVTQ